MRAGLLIYTIHLMETTNQGPSFCPFLTSLKTDFPTSAPAVTILSFNNNFKKYNKNRQDHNSCHVCFLLAFLTCNPNTFHLEKIKGRAYSWAIFTEDFKERGGETLEKMIQTGNHKSVTLEKAQLHTRILIQAIQIHFTACFSFIMLQF